MTLGEAYTLVLEREPNLRARCGFEYDAFYGFCLVPKQQVDDKELMTGITLDIVNKKTKEISKYNIMSNPAAYKSAHRISRDELKRYEP